MDLGFISLMGFIIFLSIMIPNIIYMIKNKKKKNKYKNKYIYCIEYISKAMSIILLVFPIGMKEFGFPNVAFAGIYMICNLILVITYIVIFNSYLEKETLKKAIWLSLIPTFIFLISGITLKHTLLIISSIIFGISHTYISYKNKK